MENQILFALQELSKKIDLQNETLQEHGIILGSLRSSQETLKAEISELKLQSAKDFGELKAQISYNQADVQVLKEESWNNKINIQRIKMAMGIN